MPERFGALILVTTFGCLRWSEVVALQRCDVDPSAGTVRVRQAFVEHRGTADPRPAKIAGERADRRPAQGDSAY
ncbi:hypothetical protein [Salinispora arenicola]|uniref:Tyr recombinase domain-containing protein n=1 Tax=Salinispora arenicola TaxID=168697 RepID=A0ABQ4JNW2_SALAC|nr:hypothetical protein [Salinispora arenicola]GIM83758.1 hypothetical protein Sar04_13860 [Salinispora arenicola]